MKKKSTIILEWLAAFMLSSGSVFLMILYWIAFGY